MIYPRPGEKWLHWLRSFRWIRRLSFSMSQPLVRMHANVARIANVIRELHARGKTVITITHDIDFCAENFERIIALSQGKVLLDGHAREVLGQEEILATTFVDPPQLTRLGKRLGLPVVVRNPDEFLEAYQKLPTDLGDPGE